jgi:hypothetical protein
LVDQLAALLVERGQDVRPRKVREKIACSARTYDQTLAPCRKQTSTMFDRPDAASHATRGDPAKLVDKFGVLSGSERGVEINDGHLCMAAIADRERFGVISFEEGLTSTTPCDDLTSAEINARDDHDISFRMVEAQA